MPAPKPHGTVFQAPGAGFDPMKTLRSALKFGAIYVVGQFLSDTSGLTDHLVTHFEFARQIGPAMISVLLAALKNAVSNWSKS